MRILAILLLVTVTVAGTGCRAPRPSSGLVVGGNQLATVAEIRNSHSLDVTIYVEGGSLRTRLGTVSTGTTQKFTIPPAAARGAGGLRFVVNPIGTRASFTSPTIAVQSGQTVTLTVENNMSISSIVIR